MNQLHFFFPSVHLSFTSWNQLLNASDVSIFFKLFWAVAFRIESKYLFLRDKNPGILFAWTQMKLERDWCVCQIQLKWVLAWCVSGCNHWGMGAAFILFWFLMIRFVTAPEFVCGWVFLCMCLCISVWFFLDCQCTVSMFMLLMMPEGLLRSEWFWLKQRLLIDPMWMFGVN